MRYAMPFVVYTCDLIQKKYKFTITGSHTAAALRTAEREISDADRRIRQKYRDRDTLTDPLLIARDLEIMLQGSALRILERHRVEEVTLEKFSLPSLLPDLFISDHLELSAGS